MQLRQVVLCFFSARAAQVLFLKIIPSIFRWRRFWTLDNSHPRKRFMFVMYIYVTCFILFLLLLLLVCVCVFVVVSFAFVCFSLLTMSLFHPNFTTAAIFTPLTYSLSHKHVFYIYIYIYVYQQSHTHKWARVAL